MEKNLEMIVIANPYDSEHQELLKIKEYMGEVAIPFREEDASVLKPHGIKAFDNNGKQLVLAVYFEDGKVNYIFKNFDMLKLESIARKLFQLREEEDETEYGRKETDF